jgi:hypothetical protein
MTIWTFFASKIILLRMHISTLRVAYSWNISQANFVSILHFILKENGKSHFDPNIEVLL